MKKKYSPSLKDKNDWENFTKQMENIDIKEDDFVIFDIADTHYTTKNLSNQSKIVFSVNMKEKKYER